MMPSRQPSPLVKLTNGWSSEVTQRNEVLYEVKYRRWIIIGQIFLANISVDRGPEERRDLRPGNHR